MAQLFYLRYYCKTIAVLLTVITFYSCHAPGTTDKAISVDTSPKVSPESLHFTAHSIERNKDGLKIEIDAISGYRKYYQYGKLQVEGKLIKGSPEYYREGVWNFYNQSGQLMNQETYNKAGKISQLQFMYFTNGNPLSKTYEYYEGDYKGKSTFKFHKIEILFYTNGQELAERHWLNNNLIGEKCWDSKGNPKPIGYLNTIRSVEADE